MIVLGIDPGSRITGWGMVRQRMNQTEVIASGAIVLKEGELSQRLRVLHDELGKIILNNRPDEISIESLFVHKNAMSALKLGHARGVCLLSSGLYGIPCYEYAPRAVKLAVTGSGSADKSQMQRMMKMYLKLNRSLQADEADALALAICHVHHLTSRIKRESI